MTRSRNIAVILAGGTGRRLGWGKPKQFLKIAGKTVIEHTMDTFDAHPQIDEIAVVIHPIFKAEFEELLLRNKWHKVRKILNGGAERYDSSLSAIKAYEAEDEGHINLIFHDSVRPLVSARIISDVCNQLESSVAIDVVVPPIDTIVRTDPEHRVIDSIPDRSLLMRGQTPQAFRLGILRDAYAIALQDPAFKATDDCGIVKKYLREIEISLVMGEESNIKLTTPEDIYLLDKLFQIKSTRVAETDLTELSGKVLVIFGGNSGIGADMARLARDNGAHVHVCSRSTGTDVADMTTVKAMLAGVEQTEGRIDFVVNTAAVLSKTLLVNQNAKEVSRLISINYLGAVNTTTAAYPFVKKTGGQILQFTSSSYTRGRAFYAIYSSTKAAVVNFVQAVAEEWADDGIRINCINPQRTATPMRTANFGAEDPATLLKSEDVAHISLQTLLNNCNGEVIDIKLQKIS